MIYYILLIILIVFALLFGNSQKYVKQPKYNASIILCILFIIIGGFRYQVGADWSPYLFYFNSINTWNDVWASRFEKLYELIVFCFHKFNLSYTVFIPVIFIISFLIKYNVFRRYSSNIYLSLIIYFYTVFLVYDMNGIRQGMALAVSLFSIQFIIERNLKLFLLCCAIALGFHNSSLFFIPAYWLYNYNVKLSKGKTFVLVLLLLLLAIPLREFVKEGAVSVLFADEALTRYSEYLSDDYNIDSSIISMGTLQRLIILFIYVVALSIKTQKVSNFEYFLARAYFLGLVIFIIFSFSMEYAARLSFCYKILETLMVPIAFRRFSGGYKYIIYVVVFGFAFISLYQFLNLPEHGYLLPYHNQLFNF